jgi:hypothetical protein
VLAETAAEGEAAEASTDDADRLFGHVVTVSGWVWSGYWIEGLGRLHEYGVLEGGR